MFVVFVVLLVCNLIIVLLNFLPPDCYMAAGLFIATGVQAVSSALSLQQAKLEGDNFGSAFLGFLAALLFLWFAIQNQAATQCLPLVQNGPGSANRRSILAMGVGAVPRPIRSGSRAVIPMTLGEFLLVAGWLTGYEDWAAAAFGPTGGVIVKLLVLGLGLSLTAIASRALLLRQPM